MTNKPRSLKYDSAQEVNVIRNYMIHSLTPNPCLILTHKWAILLKIHTPPEEDSWEFLYRGSVEFLASKSLFLFLTQKWATLFTPLKKKKKKEEEEDFGKLFHREAGIHSSTL